MTVSDAFDVVVQPLVLTPPEGTQSEQKEPQKEKIVIRLNKEKMKNVQSGVEKRESLESLDFESSSEEYSEYERERGG